MITATEALSRLTPATLSHETAARLLGVELLEGGEERITVARNRSRLNLPGWKVVRRDVAPDEIEVRDELTCTAVVRCLRDLAMDLPFEEAVVAADSALRQRLVVMADLAALARAHGRGASKLRAVHEAVDLKSGSVLESLLRLAVRDAGLPAPVSQFRVTDHGHEVARVDFCWPEQRLIVEADGFAFHSNREHYRRDRQRMNQLERLGWRVLRFTWEDVRHRRDHVTGTIRACLLPLAA